VKRLEKRNLLSGLLFASPWIVGFLAFSVYPLVAALAYSFTDYSVLASPVSVGLDNYREVVRDDLFWKAVGNTLYLAALSAPLNTLVACFLAVLLNFEVRGRGAFRALYFLPSLVPLVCLGILWRWALNGEFGLVNALLRPLLDGFEALLRVPISPPAWLENPAFAKLGLVIASLWGAGHAMVIFLAGLQEAPVQLYEAAEIDGAGFWRKLRHVTLPMLTPYLFFNLIIGLIGSFNVFAVPYVMMDGANTGGAGPDRSMLFVATYIFQSAFQNWNMGYASALSLIFLCLVLALTVAVMKIAERKVHYND